jgi:ATP-dependent DNA helicase RecG
MPEYDLTGSKVKATLIGKVLDIEYAKVLAEHPNLTLEEIIILDKVQKHKEISDAEIKILKAKNLIEGRKPNFIISEKLAVKTRQVGSYLKTRGFDKQYYNKLTLDFIEKNEGGSSKSEIRELLWDKLPDILEDKQKENKISNILRELRLVGKIINLGNDAKPRWVRNVESS